MLRDTKKISIFIRGEDTEVDKSLTEKINEPMIHLIRNACDHGIESPEDIQFLKKYGADAFLVGSSLMKSDNIEENVKKLVNAI